MGNQPSSDGSTSSASIFDAAQTLALDKIVSPQPYMMSDNVWSTFFTLQQPLLNMQTDVLQPFFRRYAHNFGTISLEYLTNWTPVKNTLDSGNFRMLVRHLTRCIRFARSWKEPNAATKVVATELPQIVNVLVVVRSFCQEFIQSSGDVWTYLKAEGASKDLTAVLERRPTLNLEPSFDILLDDVAFEFVDTLFLVLLEAPNENTYDLYLEALNTVLVLGTSSTFLDFVLHHAALQERGKSIVWATGLVKRLLLSYLDQIPAPRRDAASAIAALAVLPASASKWSVVDYFTETEVFPIADRSVLLLLVLVSSRQDQNAFRDALHNLADRDESTATHGIPFSQLASVMGRKMDLEFNITLLYYCLTLNPLFRDALCRPLDVDHFVLPLLEAVYNCKSGEKLYMYLVVLLYLTENPILVQTLHQSQVTDPVLWYTERYMCDVSVGSIVLILLCRVVKANLAVYKDPFVHIAAFSTMWNVMQFAKHLHQTAAQSLVLLLTHLVKKERQFRAATDWDSQEAYLTSIRLLLANLELCCCSARLIPYNPQLMYSLLHASKVLELLQDHPNDSVRDDGALIQGVVAYLKAIVDQEGTSEHENDELPPSLSVEQVYELIQLGCKKLAPSTSHDQPSVYYCYEEDRDADKFFQPFLRRLVVDHTQDLAWNR
ncbi:hypothetical protein LEN26_006755 [Aphanomyces euteiches]|nr:hypothetical protein AeMF1_011058 [Aphanomyces euteiches]KAH9134549.1 hypothetical protein LEN26_006755 [Aphanomyces euteiches]KAH9190104.1 hypothetical protein AeNC1_007919 [Aphanomyces euteiches]